MLQGKRLVISGVANGDSLAALVAERALSQGAEVVLAAFPRDLEGARDVARTWPGTEVVPVDATVPDDLATLAGHLRSRWGGVDGILHAIAFAPRPALSSVLGVPAAAVELAFTTSVWTYAAFAELLAEMAPVSGGSLVGLDFDSARAWPVYNWMGPCKAALRSLNTYLARDLGPAGIRANLVAAGPLHTRAASGIPDFAALTEAWEEQAPMAWDPHDGSSVADAVCFLLSDAGRGITGDVVHVDGGMHAAATWRRAGTAHGLPVASDVAAGA